MTLNEAYEKALSMDCINARAEMSMSVKDGQYMEFFTVRIGPCFDCSSISFEECFKTIEAMNPAEEKAKLIAQKEAELAALRGTP